MANSIKESGGGLALQVTKPARKAGLVEENADGVATRLSGVYVYGFDGLLVVMDAERVSAADRAEIVSSAAGDTESIHRGAMASVEVAGNGYQVQLPGCRVAGFNPGDDVMVRARSGMMFLHDGNGRLVNDLSVLRDEQVST